MSYSKKDKDRVLDLFIRKKNERILPTEIGKELKPLSLPKISEILKDLPIITTTVKGDTRKKYKQLENKFYEDIKKKRAGKVKSEVRRQYTDLGLPIKKIHGWYEVEIGKKTNEETKLVKEIFSAIARQDKKETEKLSKEMQGLWGYNWKKYKKLELILKKEKLTNADKKYLADRRIRVIFKKRVFKK